MKQLKSFVLAGIVSVMAVGLLGCPLNGSIVTFGDSQLELAVRSQIDKPFGFLTTTDLIAMQVLDARNFGINRLDGLEVATNLQVVILSDNLIADLRALSNMPALQTVELENNPVVDLTPLQGALGLRQVGLCGTQVRSLTPLVINAANSGLGPNDRISIDSSLRTADAASVASLTAAGVSVVDCDESGGGSGK